MRTEYEEYRDTGMLGGYCPEHAILRDGGDGTVTTSFRDAAYWQRDGRMVSERDMLIGGKAFHVTSVFPGEVSVTPTDKLLSLIDADLAKTAHGA